MYHSIFSLRTRNNLIWLLLRYGKHSLLQVGTNCMVEGCLSRCILKDTGDREHYHKLWAIREPKHWGSLDDYPPISYAMSLKKDRWLMNSTKEGCACLTSAGCAVATKKSQIKCCPSLRKELKTKCKISSYHYANSWHAHILNSLYSSGFCVSERMWYN